MTSKYIYSISNHGLNDEQRQFYEKNGYIIIRNNVDHRLLDEVSQRFVDICEGRVHPGFATVMKDPYLKLQGASGVSLINKVQDFLFDEVLFKYCVHKPIVDVVESIVGPNITAVHSMFISKPPNSDPGSSLHPLHQDLHYFPFRPANSIVASWTAIDHVDKTNGGLYVVPGSHLEKLHVHTYPKGFEKALYHGVQGFDGVTKIDCIVDKGDTVFFHPLILHGSGPNLTQGFRKCISCHYADSGCNFINIEGTSQHNIAKEIEAIAEKRGFEIKFTEYAKAKTRLVKGAPGSFQTYRSNL